jgi:aryl-alcohol dehydrogenase-like predicted oxidoreductase
MEYSTLGRTGAQVSHLGYGGAVLGLTDYLYTFDPNDPDDRAKLFEGIDAALESGINLFDTAPGYGNGASEKVLGEALKGVTASGGVPLFVSTKVKSGAEVDVRESLERSLERLGRDSVDLLQIHGTSYTRDDVFTSEDNNDGVYRLIRSGLFDTMQICYNFIFQHPYEPSRPFGSLLEAKKNGLGVLTMRAPTSGTFQRWIEMVNPANTFDYTPALIQFVLSNPLVDVALVGMRDADLVHKNVAIVENTGGRISLDALHERYV